MDLEAFLKLQKMLWQGNVCFYCHNYHFFTNDANATAVNI